MFVGHFGPAFAARAARPDLSLGGLFLAAQLPDIVFSVLVATGIERVRVHEGRTGPGAVEMVSVPFSHSLPGTLGLAVLAVAAFRLVRGRRASPAALSLVGAVVISHWVFDVVVHRADVPLAGDVRVGLGLPPVTGFALEAMLVVAGITALMCVSRPRGLAGRIAPPAFGLLLIAFGTMVALTAPPSDPVLLGLSNLAAYLVLAAAAEWIGRLRRPRAPRFRTPG